MEEDSERTSTKEEITGIENEPISGFGNDLFRQLVK